MSGRRNKFRDARPQPELPPPDPQRFQWRPMVEIVLGPPQEKRPLLFEIVRPAPK
jgi:hypothetical protein